MASYIPDYGALTPTSFAMPQITGMGSLGDINAVVSPADTTGIGKIPGVGTGGMFGGGLGLNMDTAKLGLAGIGTIGSLWGAFQAASLAKKQFAYTKQTTDTNMANQLKTYNTALTDRANNRGIVEGRTPDQVQSYISANELRRYGS